MIADLDGIALVGLISRQACQGSGRCKCGSWGGLSGSQLLQEAGEGAGAPAHKVVPPLLPWARYQHLQSGLSESGMATRRARALKAVMWLQGRHALQ